MRNRTAAVLFAIGLTAAAQTYPVTQGKTYKFEKVAEGVYYATGGSGSNNVVIVNDQDVVLVDDGTTPAAARAFLVTSRRSPANPFDTWSIRIFTMTTRTATRSSDLKCRSSRTNTCGPRF